MVIRFLVADDSRAVRDTVAWILQGEPGLELVGVAANGAEAVELAERLVPDVILMDINMPMLDGVEATRQITVLCPNVRVIGLSLDEKDVAGPKMQAAGAVGYVSKSASSAEMVAAIRAAMADA
jgi:DNA-binding NarL/FixJ family response regulator